MHFIDPHATKNKKKMPPFSSWRRRNNGCLHFPGVNRLRKGGKFNLWSENQLSARFVELAPETKQTSHCRKSSRWKKGWGKNEGKVLNFPNAARVQHFLGVEKKNENFENRSEIGVRQSLVGFEVLISSRCPSRGEQRKSINCLRKNGLKNEIVYGSRDGVTPSWLEPPWSIGCWVAGCVLTNRKNPSNWNGRVFLAERRGANIFEFPLVCRKCCLFLVLTWLVW